MKEIKTLKRFSAIIAIGLKPGSFTNLEDLAQKLDNQGIEPVGYRTLIRDLEALRNEFGINFKYSNLDRRWLKIESDEVSDHAQFLNLLDLEGLSRTLRNAFEGFHFLDLEAQSGASHIQPKIKALLEAIQSRKVVKVNYKSFQSESEKHYELEPLKLKEYRSRWYLAGADIKERHTIKTFGIERIVDIQISNKSFEVEKLKEEVKNRFANVLGVTLLPDQAVDKILVKVSPKFSNYLISIPLHKSQMNLGLDKDGWTLLTWDLVINQELISEIIRFGDDVVVLEPDTLIRTIVNKLKSSISRYG